MSDVSRLTETVRSFRRLKALVVGDLVLDEYLFGKTTRISREAPVPIVDLEGGEMRPGGAANTAANMAAMGARTAVVGAVGGDQSGQRLVEILKSFDIDARGISTLPGRLTTTKTRVMAGDLHTARQQLIRIDRGERGNLPFAQAERIAARISKLASKCHAVAFSDYGFGILSEPALEKLRKAARHIPVVADSRFDLIKLSGMTAVTPNEPECEQALGMRIGGEDDVKKAASSLLKKLKCSNALITRGNKGMALFSRSRKALFLPIAQESEAVDVTGAGDTVVAAFTLALAAGSDPADAAVIANHAASIAVSRSGAVAVTGEEIVASLESHG